MKDLKQYWAFWIPYFIFIAGLFTLIIINEKAELHLLLNTHHTPYWDIFFKYFTLIGEWIPFVVCIGLLFYKYRAALLVSSSILTAGIVTQILKRIFNHPRPKRYFLDNFPDIELYRVAGTKMYSYYSFPSGHTTAAFAMLFSLALLTKNKTLQFLYCLIAILVGYSRIYLSQHFANDVLVGALIGVIMTIICQYFIDRKPPTWYNKSLLKRN